MIVRCTSIEQPGWLALRQALWPHCSREAHLSEMFSFLAHRERFAQFVAYTEARQPLGFVEASVRTDCVNGTDSSPVGFLEGIYVLAEARRKGIATNLLAAALDWAKALGCREFASDAPLENAMSHQFHRALGFQETERVIFFRKVLS
ncbi:MAG: GNAT family N-acetyltransferase [Betaproteobacteria bacterium]|nr:MAG: GNAT family N-acetyltransferase [Betaproteobacteria bacterium]